MADDLISVAPLRPAAPCQVIGCGHRPGLHVILEDGSTACGACLDRRRRAERRVRDWESEDGGSAPRPHLPRVEPRHHYSTSIQALTAGRV